MSEFKKPLFNQFAQVAKAMSNGNRLEMLEFLAQGEHSVEHLARSMKLTVANTSHHLQQLRSSGLVEIRKEGTHVHYRLKGEKVITLLDTLKQVAEDNLAEVEVLVNTFLTSKDDSQAVTREELMAKVEAGSVQILDVRPEHEFEAGHVSGAINLPLAQLEQQLGSLDPKQEVVAYCRGPYCLLAFEAVALLRNNGFSIKRLEDGYPEWKVAGLPCK